MDVEEYVEQHDDDGIWKAEADRLVTGDPVRTASDGVEEGSAAGFLLLAIPRESYQRPETVMHMPEGWEPKAALRMFHQLFEAAVAREEARQAELKAIAGREA